MFKRRALTNEIIHNSLKDIVPVDQITGLYIDGGSVQFSILVDPDAGAAMEDLRQKAEHIVLSIKGVDQVTAILTAERPALQESADPHGMNKNPKLNLPIKKIIAVASGKGGVGKSTVAVNLAAALANKGQDVGLLDADIYGPSVPHLTGLPYVKPNMNEQKKLIPFDVPGVDGLKVMSIGFMVDQDTPMIWRGPMVQSAIYQMLRDVQWAQEGQMLDVLVIDMPPGTGDAQLTIAQKINVDGAVIVSTPQDLALIDAIKAVEMFKKTDVPVLGIVENMSTHICTSCGHEEHIFGYGGVLEEANKRDIKFLGAIPLSRGVRESADQGKIDQIDLYNDIVDEMLSALEY